MAKTINELLVKVCIRVAEENPSPDEGCQSRQDGWLCSRAKGHNGMHIAVAGTDMCAMWRQGYGDPPKADDER